MQPVIDSARCQPSVVERDPTTGSTAVAFDCTPAGAKDGVHTGVLIDVNRKLEGTLRRYLDSRSPADAKWLGIKNGPVPEEPRSEFVPIGGRRQSQST